ncbi:hypothetical protein CsSME_00010020 [Camellia sinensis var. sinensis]
MHVYRQIFLLKRRISSSRPSCTKVRSTSYGVLDSAPTICCLKKTYYVWDVATGNTTGGCMTNSFIQAMENEYGLTYACLLHSIHTKIWESQKHLYPPPPTSQVPQLSSSEKFDIHANIITI